jgi:hypothetical protein
VFHAGAQAKRAEDRAQAKPMVLVVQLLSAASQTQGAPKVLLRQLLLLRMLLRRDGVAAAAWIASASRNC